MMNQSTASNATTSRDLAKAALTRIRLIHDTSPYLLDDKHLVRSINFELEAAQTFLRDNIDLPGSTTYEAYDLDNYEGLTEKLKRSIIDDLATIWDYDFYRDEISQLAMAMSLCPLHFCDWASCFDDEDEECAQIQAIFPHSH